MKKKILHVGKILLLVFVTKTSFSQISKVNKSLHYQGAVRTSVGLPLGNKNITVRSSIIDGSATGTVVYWEVRDIKTNALGLYSFNIGDGNDKSKSGPFENIDWSNNNTKYIKIEVDPNAGTNFSISGVQPLSSVPYALAAGSIYGRTINATNIIPGNPNQVLTTTPDGKDVYWNDVSGLVNLNGDVTGPSNSTVIKDGAITSSKLGNMGATGGQVLKFNATTGKWEPANDDNTMYNGSPSVSLDPTTQTFTRAALTGDVTAAANSNTLIINNGAVTGDKIGAGAVTGDKIADGALTTDKIADGAVTGDKIGDMGATTGQVLKYNTTTGKWEPANDEGTTYNGSPSVSLDPATNTFTRSALTGDVTAADNSNVLTIAPNAVDGTKIAAGAVTGDKISTTGATNGQVLTFNGTTWTPTTIPAGATYNGSPSVSLDPATNTFTRSALTGDVTAAANSNTLTIAPNAVDGTKIANNAIDGTKIADNAVDGTKIADMSATNGQVLTFNSTTNTWAPTTPSAGTVYASSTSVLANGSTFERAALTGDVTAAANSNALTIANGAVNSAKIADGTVTGTDLATNTITDANLATGAVTATKIADNAVDGTKIADMSATNGQVLTFNTTTNTWAPTTPSAGTVYASSASVLANGSTFERAALTGDVNAAVNSNTLTIATGAVNSAKIADGTVTGADLATNTITDANLATGAVTATKIADNAVDGTKIADMSATNGQVLTFNTTTNTWAPTTIPAGAIYNGSPSVALDPATNTFTRPALTGDVNAAANSNTLTIAANAVTGDKIADMSATNGQVLTFNTTTNTWEPKSLPASAAGVFTSNTDDVTLTAAADYNKPFLYGGVTGSSLSAGSKLFYDPSKGALRIGNFTAAQLTGIEANSVAIGANKVLGANNFAFGNGNAIENVNASSNVFNGANNISIGNNNITVENTGSYILNNTITIGNNNSNPVSNTILVGRGLVTTSPFEMALGSYNKQYTEFNINGWDNRDRLLTIGNGIDNDTRSDALVILKSGNVGIGESTPDRKLVVKGDARITALDNGQDVNTYSRAVVADASGNLGYAARSTSSTFQDFSLKIPPHVTDGVNPAVADFNNHTNTTYDTPDWIVISKTSVEGTDAGTGVHPRMVVVYEYQGTAYDPNKVFAMFTAYNKSSWPDNFSANLIGVNTDATTNKTRVTVSIVRVDVNRGGWGGAFDLNMLFIIRP